MKDSNVFEYMTMEQTLGLGLFINTITYSLIGDVKTKVFDPVFEEIFPQEYFLLKINLGKKTVDLGGAAYEIFRWVNYATFIYFCARVLFEYKYLLREGPSIESAPRSHVEARLNF